MKMFHLLGCLSCVITGGVYCLFLKYVYENMQCHKQYDDDEGENIQPLFFIIGMALGPLTVLAMWGLSILRMMDVEEEKEEERHAHRIRNGIINSATTTTEEEGSEDGCGEKKTSSHSKLLSW